MTMILTCVTMLGWADVPDSDRGDFRRRRAVDISSLVHVVPYWWSHGMACMCVMSEEDLNIFDILYTHRVRMLVRHKIYFSKEMINFLFFVIHSHIYDFVQDYSTCISIANTIPRSCAKPLSYDYFPDLAGTTVILPVQLCRYLSHLPPPSHLLRGLSRAQWTTCRGST